MKKVLSAITLFASLAIGNNFSEAKTLKELLVEKGVISEEESKGTKDTLFSAKGLDFSLGGKLEFEYVDNEANEYKGHFGLDVLEIYPGAATKSGITFKAEIVVEQSKTVVEEAYVIFPDILPGNTYLKVGKDDRFIKRNRKTETYPIAGTQFWRDDVEGIWFHGGRNNIYWDASFTNSFELSSKSTIEETVSDIKVLHDNRAKGDRSSKKEVGVRLGYRLETDAMKMDASIFYFDSEVGNITETKATTVLGINSNDDRDFIGARISGNYGKFTLIGEYVDASYGDFDTDTWYIEPSFKNSVDGYKYFKGYEVVLRYNERDPDVPRDLNEPLTWKLKQTTIAFIASPAKTVKLKAEYNFLSEENGGSEVDNDELLVQLEYKF